MRSLDLAILGSFVTALFTAGCAGSEAQVSTYYAPGFTPSAAAISVLGVFKDGRMREDAWEALDPVLPKPFQSDSCTAGFGSLALADPDLFAQVDTGTMEDGVTEEMINNLAPAANGKTILLISTWGMASTEHKVPGSPAAAAPAAGMGGGGRHRGGGGGGGSRRAGSPRTVGEPGVIKVIASIYSIAAHARVATLTVKYTGDDANGALKTFEQELGKLLAGSTCADWTWKNVTASFPGAL